MCEGSQYIIVQYFHPPSLPPFNVKFDDKLQTVRFLAGTIFPKQLEVRYTAVCQIGEGQYTMV